MNDTQTPKAATEEMYFREYWSGDSRDGTLVDGDGYHYFAMSADGTILQAFEYYETDDGVEVASPLPEMLNVNWIKDLGFDDWDTLDPVTEDEFTYIKDMCAKA